MNEVAKWQRNSNVREIKGRIAEIERANAALDFILLKRNKVTKELGTKHDQSLRGKGEALRLKCCQLSKRNNQSAEGTSVFKKAKTRSLGKGSLLFSSNRKY